MQYGFSLDTGRTGVSLSIFRLNKAAEVEYNWVCMFNSKGIEVKRSDREGNEVLLCDFDTFLYPDAVEEDELQLVDVLSGFPVKEDRDVISLCSFLVAKWAAGHNEDSFHNVIADTLETWKVIDPDNISVVP